MSMVATKSFTWHDGDELVEFHAGITHVADGYPALRDPAVRHHFAPPAWGPIGRRETRSRSSTMSARATAIMPRRTTVSLLRDRTPRFEVELGPDLVWSIEREISETLGTYGVVETGGYLVGHRWDYIGIQTGPGPKSTHAAHRFQLDDSAADRWLDSDPLLRIVGDWHLHPGDDDGVPSDHDVRGWAGHTTRSMSHYVGIVATKGELGFMTPELYGWVAFFDGDTAVCEPALLSGY